MVVAAVMAAEAALMVAGAEAPTVAAGPMAGIPLEVEVTIAAASAANRPGAQRAG
jgi:hypothetical protein